MLSHIGKIAKFKKGKSRKGCVIVLAIFFCFGGILTMKINSQNRRKWIMSKQPFIGIGHNPEGPDLPLGLGLNLAQDSDAMDTFGAMTEAQREKVVRYIQGAATGEDAKNRITGTIQKLHDHQTDGF